MRIMARLPATGCLALIFGSSVLGASVSGAGCALAQSAVTEEAIAPDGAVMQSHAFTAAQRHAIYSAAIRQKARAPSGRIPASVGAAVPVSVELRDLPDQANDGDGDRTSRVLKYALVDSDVVVVDPLAMRVVDVIHGGARP